MRRTLTLRGAFRHAAALAFAVWLGFGRAEAGDFDHSHALLDKVLKTYTTNGLVDYLALKSHSEDLDAYLDQTAAVPAEVFLKWTEPRRLAFCINVYNAATLRLILDHYPIKSIKKIGGWFSGPWDQPVVRLFGGTNTLGHLEHEILREQFDEPRIHFAIVCGASGCPPLRNEGYTADRLDQQLKAQGQVFLNTPTKNRIDLKSRILHLSPIFKWFEEDFSRGYGSVQKFVAGYFPPEVGRELNRENFRIKYTEYDWSLNSTAPARR